MQDRLLHTNLIDATARILTQFGKGIIHEDRFVNILSDLYPERDNPAIFKIIKSVIQDKLLKDILNSNVNTIEHEVASAISTLNKKYGYDQSLSESILFSLAVGYGTLSQNQYNALKSLKNKTKKKQTPPLSQNNNTNTSNSNSKKNKPIQHASLFNARSAGHAALLLWGVLGLLASPVIYAIQISEKNWWPLPTSIIIALIHYITIVPASIPDFYIFTIKGKRRVHPLLKGGFCALYILAIIFWIVFPFFWGIEDVQSFWGFSPNKEGFPWILTIGGNIFCAMLLGVFLSEGVTKFSRNGQKNNVTFFANFKELFIDKSFRSGFLLISAIFILEGLAFISVPIVKQHKFKQLIETRNKQIDAFNQHNDSLRNERSKTERKLSFAQFNIGDSFSSCLSKINKNDSYTVLKFLPDDLIINGEDYISIVDTIIHLETDWNNENIIIKMHFTNRKLFALLFSQKKTDCDTLIASYVAKYGEPESQLMTSLSISDYDLPMYHYYPHYILLDTIIPDHFYWTYKNSMIEIKDNGKYEGTTTTYFDRAAEVILRQHKDEQARKEKASIQRMNDSLRRAREETERKLKEKKRKEELIRQESMKQI